MKKEFKIVWILAIGYIIATIISVITTIILFDKISITSLSYLFIFLMQVLVLYVNNRKTLKRKMPLDLEKGHGWIFVIIITGIITMCVASMTAYRLTGVLSQYAGIVLILIANVVAIQAMISYPAFAKILYNEDKKEDQDEGTYSILRHPFGLSAILLLLSIPLVLGSTWAFLSAGIGVIFVLVWVASVDHYRFVNYDWYYDYTKRVPYRIIPYIY